MLQFLVGCGCGYEKTFAVSAGKSHVSHDALVIQGAQLSQAEMFQLECGDLPSCQSADNSGAGNCCPDNRDDILQLGLEDTVKVFAGANSCEGVGVCECREDSDPERKRIR